MNETYLWIAISIGVILIVIFFYYLMNKNKAITEYYEDKKIRRQYTIDKKGFKQKSDRFYFRNGKINKEQIWINNQLDGESKIFYSTGELYIHSNYKNNLLDGEYVIYDLDGRILKSELYKDGNCIEVIQDLTKQTKKYEEFDLINEENLLDEKILEEFLYNEDNYLIIKHEEETNDRENNRGGFFQGLKKIGKVVSGIEAYQSRKSSIHIKESCEEYYDAGQKVTEIGRKMLNKNINEFGKYRLESLQSTTGRFLGILKDMKKENKLKEYEILNNIGINTDSIKRMERLDMDASSALKSSATVGVLGTAAAMGTPAIVTSAVGALATASTGTAISSLSGVAATNATLAWLGGGSLATGGGGMAAGATVLSGITMGATAGVGLIAAGLIASTYYSKKLTEAKDFQKNVECHIADMKNLWGVLEGINKRTNELTNVTKKLEARLKTEINYLEPLAIDYNTNNNYYNIVFQRVGLLAKSMSDLAQTPLLDSEGNTSKMSEQIIQDTNKVLNKTIINYG